MKKWLIVTMLLFSTSSIVNASSIHGEFEGNPIVTLKSNGQDLKVEDIPAINYKDRTLVPIYLLKQLGATVNWDPETYSVDVKLTNNVKKIDSNEKEQILLKDTYQWLSDTDNAMWMFSVKLQQYTNLDNPEHYLTVIDTDYQSLLNLHNNSMDFALKTNKLVSSATSINDIIFNESKTMDQINQTKNLLKAWISTSNKSDFASNLKLSILNSLQVAQQNISNTKQIIHQMILKETEINLTSN
ncbi:stalk domain-containing protein [Paenibacillus sp. GP183]|uniref:stalk domain-containing protein n=1 Tax=Paenibacillus sp. GP183 TaxID=1882751 RepID=UPI00089C04F1|nr:stalk domain-containing protein [Paenibacillus sp. GP183]SEC33794.1 Copper amine oxidase N-terminal domain-containing protein [Paenibacillus sp. GP183]